MIRDTEQWKRLGNMHLTSGERLAALREDEGMKQADLAEKLGVSQGSISGWESNRVSPPIEIYKVLAAIYGTTVDWLLCMPDAEPYPGANKHIYPSEVVELANRLQEMPAGLRRGVIAVATPVIDGYQELWDSKLAYAGDKRHELVSRHGEEWVRSKERKIGVQLPLSS